MTPQPRVFAHWKTPLGEGAEAKKRMFNLVNRHPIENKETLDEQTGAKRRNQLNRKAIGCAPLISSGMNKMPV